MSDKKEESQPSTLSEAEAEQALAKAEYEAAKENAEEAKPSDGTLRTTKISDSVAATETVAQAEIAYETAKSAVIGLTRSFARDFGKYNIRCNSVTPGSIATERQIKHWLTPKYQKFILDKQCLKRQLKPQDVANLILFLSSDVSSGCTKQNYIIDAGIV